MRTSLRLLAASGAILALLACQPVDRQYDTGTTTTMSTTGTGGMGTGGTSGTGGTAQAGSCTTVGTTFSILGTQDLGTDALDDKPVLVPDSGQGHAMVHVVVNDKTAGKMIIRSLVDDPTATVGNLASLSGGFTPVGGWVTPGASLFVQGSIGNVAGTVGGIGQVTFSVDPQKGVTGTGSFSPYATPSDCKSPGHVQNLAVTQEGTDTYYIASCASSDTSPSSATLWLGNVSSQGVGMVSSGMSTDAAMKPDVYLSVGGVRFVSFKGEMGQGGGFAYGTKPTDLATFHPVDLVSGQTGSIMAGAPDATGGLAIFAASVGSGFTGASLWSGDLTTSGLDTLSTSASTALQQVYTVSDIAKAGGFSHATTDQSAVLMAGPTLDSKSVTFDWFTRDARALVVEQVVYTTSSATVVAAGAAPLGSHYVVVWVEQDSAGAFQVVGQRLLCSQS